MIPGGSFCRLLLLTLGRCGETPSDTLKHSYIWESFCKYFSRSNMLLLTHLLLNASFFSLLGMMDCLSFDKVWVKGEVL